PRLFLLSFPTRRSSDLLTIMFTALSFAIIWGLGIWKVYREFSAEQTEVTVSWFQILNSFFIITLASSFSKMWERIWNPSGAVKLDRKSTRLNSSHVKIS